MLQLKTEQVFLVQDNELANFIAQAYGLKKYELVAIEEMSNGDYQLFKVETGQLSQYEERSLRELKETGFKDSVTDTVLKDLCNKGWIAPGSYLVHAFW